MMLQLFLTVVMLALAAFELVVLYEGHFVARSVGQFETAMRERSTLDFLVNHCIARLVDEIGFRAKIRAQGSVEYTVPVEQFLSAVGKDVVGVVVCSALGDASFTIVVSLCKKSNHADVIATNTVELVWDEKRLVYLVRYTAHS